MVRPKLHRLVRFRGNFHYFKPQAIPLSELSEVILTVDEFEAMRLKDKLGLDQTEAAEKMNISQPTFHRILESARKKIAEAIVDGKAIRIQGGACKMPNKDGTGPEGKGPRTGRGLGNCPSTDKESLDETRPRRKGLGPCGAGARRGRR
ncbi:DUF134 domain-containing protein [Nanoarchaeota archaeon]